MDNWQRVYQDDLNYRAEIVKAVLEDYDLNPVLLNKKETSTQIGSIEVLVSPEHVIQALKIINEEIKF